ncbi:DedA family protein [Pengzhenrongella sicca]|uniref:DedA family protein n=1 Tax=Pengzhenrongella sicca TaxID=2819238 RepID=A0A8A4ZL95_9MICO|nr:DedA family protein [Pengzhenrongella sicca]
MLEWILALAASPLVYVVLYLFATIDGFFPPIPSESVIIALAALSVTSGHPNIALIAVVAAAGAFTGDQIAYAIGQRIDVRRIRFLRGPRGQRTLDWAERALTHRGPSFILAARYVPIGRVAVNMTAGALAYPRRRFVPLTALAACTWSVYSVAIGLGAGVWFADHPLIAICVGVAGGVVIGLVVDWALASRQRRKERSAGRAATPRPGGRTDPEPRPGLAEFEPRRPAGDVPTTAARLARRPVA